MFFKETYMIGKGHFPLTAGTGSFRNHVIRMGFAAVSPIKEGIAHSVRLFPRRDCD